MPSAMGRTFAVRYAIFKTTEGEVRSLQLRFERVVWAEDDDGDNADNG